MNGQLKVGMMWQIRDVKNRKKTLDDHVGEAAQYFRDKHGIDPQVIEISEHTLSVRGEIVGVECRRAKLPAGHMLIGAHNFNVASARAIVVEDPPAGDQVEMFK